MNLRWRQVFEGSKPCVVMRQNKYINDAFAQLREIRAVLKNPKIFYVPLNIYLQKTVPYPKESRDWKQGNS
jgi:hypothetical protein